jgi:hypothetical protein
MIKEFCSFFIYQPGKEQIVADCLSQQPQLEEADINKPVSYEPLSMIGIFEPRPLVIHFF